MIPETLEKAPGAAAQTIARVEEILRIRLQPTLRDFYLASNGAQGWVGERWCELWTVEEILTRDLAYATRRINPELLLIGSDGGHHAFAADRAGGGLQFWEADFSRLSAAWPLATDLDEFFRMLEDLPAAAPAGGSTPQSPWQDLLKPWLDEGWRTYVAAQGGEARHLHACKRDRGHMDAGWIAAGNAPTDTEAIRAGFAGLAVRAIRETGSLRIRFTDPQGTPQPVPEELRQEALREGHAIREPARGVVAPESAALLAAAWSGIPAALMAEFSSRTELSLTRAAMLVSRNIWPPEELDLLCRITRKPREIFEGRLHPENRMAYLLEMPALRIAVMGMLADVHLKAARPGRWIALPNLRGYAAGPDGPVAFISPRSLADGISHWKWDIERLRHLRGRPKYLVTPSDFNDAPRRTELETSARAHGIDILALPVSLEEIDADARKRMELAADYRKPGIETRL